MATKIFMTVLVLISCIVAVADDFSDLENKAKKEVAANPFANRKARCMSRVKNIELKETWDFLSTGRYSRRLDVGITQTGSYEVNITKKVLSIKGDKNKAFDYKYKMNNGGFQYIHENNGDKTLYSCRWVG